MDILYANEGLVDAADSNENKWGTNEGLMKIASNTTNRYNAELKMAAKYVLGNKELLNKLCGSDGLFGAGCDTDDQARNEHFFRDSRASGVQFIDDELYKLSNDPNLKSYGGNTSKGFSTPAKEMTTVRALSIMAANREALDNADGNANKWANKDGLLKFINGSGRYDKDLGCRHKARTRC
jgi:hypothetical protein